MHQMAPAARRILETVLGVKPGEQVTIVTDTGCPSSVTEVLATMAASFGAKTIILTMPPHEVGGQEPLPVVTAAMHASDAVILQDSYALVHTDAFREATQKGVRLIELWGVTEEMMVKGGLLADHREVGRLTTLVEEAMKAAREVRLTTPGGTDIRMKIGAHPTIPLTGEALFAGSFCSLPGGELAIAPDEGTAEGVLADPFLLEQRDMAYRQDPLRIEVKGGRVASVSGGREARTLEKMLASAGETGRNIAEFAIGTNGWCRPYATLREAKKALGTAHMAIGDSRTLMGDVSSPIHMDMIFDHPTVILDGQRELMKDGKLLVG